MSADEVDPQVSWATRLEAVRSRRGMSQEELAHRLGVSFTTVSRWLNQRAAPSGTTVARLAAVLTDLEDEADTPPPPFVLPPDRTRFVGRDRELADLLQIWPRRRLLTLTGPGGIGKTRLATEILRRGSDPVLGVVAFDVLGDPSLVVSALALSLSIDSLPTVSHAEGIVQALAAAHGVLVLDTCERVRQPLRGVVSAILAGAPNVRILATSQATLALAEEHVWRVHPMDFTGSEGDAARLFIERATDRSGHSLTAQSLPDVREICERLDGMPLALELAAAWMSSMTPAQLLQRWDERGELLADSTTHVDRHRTPGAAVAWSAALLSDRDQRLVAELSVFVGPFQLDDVEAIATYDTRADLLARLRILVDLSWLEFDVTDTAHYRMLDPLKAWGLARLDDLGRTSAVRARLAEHVTGMCERAEAERFQGKAASEWLKRLERTSGSITTSLSWASIEQPELATRIAVSLLGWWRNSGRFAEGRHWLAIARANTQDRSWRARATCAEALLTIDAGEYDQGQRLAVEALADLDALGDDRWAARALTACSSAAKYRGEHAVARAQLESAAFRLERLGDPRELAMLLNNLGAHAAETDDLEAARRYYDNSLALKRTVGDRRSTALTMANLADVCVKANDLTQAMDLLDEATQIAEGLDDLFLLDFIYINRGEALLHAGKHADALDVFTLAKAHADALRATRFQALASCGIGQALHALGRTTHALPHLRESREIAERIGDEILLVQIRRAMSAAVGFAPEVRLPKNLSSRQVQVLQYLMGGLSNKELAARLNITPATVQSHLSSIYRKLGVRNRTEAADVARELGLRRNS